MHTRFVWSVWCAALLGCSAYDPRLLPERASLRGNDAGTDAAGGGGALDARGPSVNAVDTCSPATELSICTRQHADGVCLDSACKIVRCRQGFLDCDHDQANGCEASLDTPQNCGACGASCDLNHVLQSVCTQGDAGHGTCSIDHGCAPDAPSGCAGNAAENGCEPGFGDCDGIAANGCETSLRTLSDCGACKVSCGQAGSQASCDTGKCSFVGCSETFADCGSGCISLVSDPAHCGACAKACPSSTASMCAGGRCTSVSCPAGQADCDGNASNGCETDLGVVASCGSCDVHCGPYANGTAGCSSGQCALTCTAGFADCNKSRDDGCEADLAQVASCGACGMSCAELPHVASAQCAGGACTRLVCESGFGDCDGDPANGCEQALNTNDHCGACAPTCYPANATGTCQSGSCAITACADRYEDCDGQVGNGCEASLDSSATCGGCNNACQGGTVCQNGGCTCSGTSCPSGQECCGGACIDTSGRCYPWPCIPGTSRDRNNCGGCGMKCATWCCQ